MLIVVPVVHNCRSISAQTVRNRLPEDALSACLPYVGCVLGRRYHVNRVNWVRTHQRWLRQQWNSVLFSDESRFTIHRDDGRVRVYRREINFMPTVAYLNDIVLGVGVGGGF